MQHEALMKRHLTRLALASLSLASLPAFADSLQKKCEDAMAAADSVEKKDAVVDAAIGEGLAFPKDMDFASYLTEFQDAYAQYPAAWARYVKDPGTDSQNVEKRRGQFLSEIRRPLSEAHLSLARHHMQSKRTGLGYGLDVSELFHKDLDRAIVLKNAAALHPFFFRYLAKADLDSDGKNPPGAYRGILAGVARETGGYTIPDFKDIFYFQAPEASADYIDEEIFSLYRTLKEQKAAVDPIVRLVNDVAGSEDAPFPERHRRLRRMLGALVFGAGASVKEIGVPVPPSFDEAQRAVTGWALRQGLMRTMLFGKHLANEYGRCLQNPEGLERLRALQKRLQAK
jgi:hypothetical protein